MWKVETVSDQRDMLKLSVQYNFRFELRFCYGIKVCVYMGDIFFGPTCIVVQTAALNCPPAAWPKVEAYFNFLKLAVSNLIPNYSKIENVSSSYSVKQ